MLGGDDPERMNQMAETPERDQERPTPHSPMSSMRGQVIPAMEPVDLDDIDRSLLRHLVADARLSQRQLAREVGMSAPAVGERVARLERLGLIHGYTARVDWGGVGYPGLVFIPMTLATDADVPAILEQLRDIPELTELVVVTGGYDFMARFRIRDHAHLQRLLLDRIWPIRGLQRIETLLSLGEIVSDRTALEVLGGAPVPAADDRDA